MNYCFSRIGIIKAVTDLKTIGRNTAILLVELNEKPSFNKEEVLYIKLEEVEKVQEEKTLISKDDQDGSEF